MIMNTENDVENKWLYVMVIVGFVISLSITSTIIGGLLNATYKIHELEQRIIVLEQK